MRIGRVLTLQLKICAYFFLFYYYFLLFYTYCLTDISGSVVKVLESPFGELEIEVPYLTNRGARIHHALSTYFSVSRLPLISPVNIAGGYFPPISPVQGNLDNFPRHFKLKHH